MYEQISIYDIDPDVEPVPELWECRKTCAKFGLKVDYPEWWHGEARCLYGMTQKNGIEQTVRDNTAHLYCRFYERRKSG
jgi:hypothetical protein